MSALTCDECDYGERVKPYKAKPYWVCYREREPFTRQPAQNLRDTGRKAFGYRAEGDVMEYVAPPACHLFRRVNR